MSEAIGMIDITTFHEVLRDTINIYDVKRALPYAIKLNWRGEPLMHPQICRMVKIAKSYGVYEVLLNTNGLLLTESKINALNQAGLDTLIVSADGSSKSTYETIRRGGDFKTLYSVIAMIADKFHGHFRIQACRQPANEREIDQGRWHATWRLYADELRVGQLYDPQGQRRLKMKQPKSCTSPWQRIMVSWNGDIVPCPADFNKTHVIGNVKNMSIRDAWHSDIMKNLRKALKCGGRAAHALCRNCTSYCGH